MKEIESLNDVHLTYLVFLMTFLSEHFIDVQDDICCICCENGLDSYASLDCCNIRIHKRCLLHTILRGYVTCALCRTEFVPFKQFNKKSVLQYFYQLEKPIQIQYSYQMQCFLHQLKLYKKQNKEMIPYYLYAIIRGMKRCFQYILMIITIICFYMIVFYLLSIYSNNSNHANYGYIED